MKPPGKRLLKRLHALPVLAEPDHPPALPGTGTFRHPPGVAIPPGRLEKCVQLTRQAVVRRWHRLRPLAHARHDLHAFAREMAQWLGCLHALDALEKNSIQAAENALIALVVRVEDGPLAYCTHFPSLYACHLGHQWKSLHQEARARIQRHARWLLDGSDNGQIRSLFPRIEHRRVGFGWYEDYFRHMSRAQYVQFQRGCQILADHAPQALDTLLLLR